MLRREFLLSVSGILLTSAQKLRADHHVVSADPLVVEFDLWSLEGRYTRVEDFYVRNHFEAPESSNAVLRIEGEVESPRTLTPGTLSALAQHDIPAVLECAGDPVRAVSLVSDGVWQGWKMADILAFAHPKASGAFLHLMGRDGFSRSVPAERVMSDGWLVTKLNGRPLVRDHGAPWRALFPGWYGMDSVKWLEKMVVARNPLPPVGDTYLDITRQPSGALVKRRLPRVQVKSVITAPADGAVVRRGKIQLRGLAWTGSGRIRSVKVSANSGAIRETATIEQAASPYDWVRWSASVMLSRPGVTEIVSKATDSAGNTQPETRAPGRLDLYAYNVCGRVRCVVV